MTENKRFLIDDAGKHKIRRKDIGELEKIVKSKGLLWRKF